MNDITERAYAKLNLSLDILGARPDGYHEMKMVMQSIELCDHIAIKLNTNGQFAAKSNMGFLPSNEKNIAVRAAKLFFEKAGDATSGAEIHIKKQIPVCAGMGGGSSDGAAVLCGLNRHFGQGFSSAQLEEMSRGLGSDVPFCVSGGTALATGRGDDLRPLPKLPKCDIVVCKPAFAISTPTLFERIDGRKNALHPDTDGIIKCLDSGDVIGVAQRLYNVFEDVLPSRYEEIRHIKGRLIDLGAVGCAMTGTGSAVFGIFEDAAAARRAFDSLRQSYRECFLTSAR